MLYIQTFMLMAAALFRLPKIGKALAQILAPPGSGAPDWLVKVGSCSVYAVVTAPHTSENLVNRGHAFLSFHGDPGNAVTAQCVCESALTLLLDRDNLPPRSLDGFGTPAELLGPALMKRFQETKVRPITIKTTVKLGSALNDTKTYF